ncbi:hypothetical protein V5T82_11055 [Magnetovibrio sp. PR-2]|uniref:hypothetical protein n=1 Tax=Magnetovibrio sp. PR-2 TaxID=3120356 RepID=UPI002FCE59C1
MTSPIEHARAYPFSIPEHSYVLDNDGWRALQGDFDTHGRHAVIASGSNASPERLQAKFETLKDPIFVTQAVLKDFDAVYSAHITTYGSIPATLAHAPGVEADIFVTWLTDDQLERMHETEALGQNYVFVRLNGIELRLDDGQVLDTAQAYLSTWGCLNRGEKPIALADLSVKNRIWSAMSQAEVLDYAQSLFKSSQNRDDFIQKHIDCEVTRKGRIVRLSISALDYGWPEENCEHIAPAPEPNA